MPLKETSPNLKPHSNLMHVKFHSNKHQENLLSKRLEQINNEETRYRLKHQKTSDELIIFLRECKKTTGYFAKMKSFQSNSLFMETDNNSKTKFESKSSLDITNSTKIRSISQTWTKNGSKVKKMPVISSKSPFDLNHAQNRQRALFERILNSPGGSANSASSRSNATIKSSSSESKQELSDRSATSLCSNSIDFNEIFKQTEKKIRPTTCQFDSRANIPKDKLEYKPNRSHMDWSNNINLDIEKYPRKKSTMSDDQSRKSSNSHCSVKSSVSNFKKSEFIFDRPKFSEKLPTNTTPTCLNSPIKINMSRSSLKKQQLEIMDEYSRSTTLEKLENFRKVQQDVFIKVKKFNQKSF